MSRLVIINVQHQKVCAMIAETNLNGPKKPDKKTNSFVENENQETQGVSL